MRQLQINDAMRLAIGFDGFLNNLQRAAEGATKYPPYDVIKDGEDAYRIVIAAAGFAPENLDVEVRDRRLLVSGRHANAESEVVYLHKGLAQRGFTKEFELANHMRVASATFENGLLTISVVREVPEAEKPKKIAIAT